MKNGYLEFDYDHTGKCTQIIIYRKGKKKVYSRQLHAGHFWRITTLTIKCTSYMMQSQHCLDYRPATVIVIGDK